MIKVQIYNGSIQKLKSEFFKFRKQCLQEGDNQPVAAGSCYYIAKHVLHNFWSFNDGRLRFSKVAAVHWLLVQVFFFKLKL